RDPRVRSAGRRPGLPSVRGAGGSEAVEGGVRPDRWSDLLRVPPGRIRVRGAPFGRGPAGAEQLALPHQRSVHGRARADGRDGPGRGSAWSTTSEEAAQRAAGGAEGAWIRRVRAAVAGGWWMLALGLLLSFAGLLVLAAVKPDATHAYFKSSFNGGADNGAATIAANL